MVLEREHFARSRRSLRCNRVCGERRVACMHVVVFVAVVSPREIRHLCTRLRKAQCSMFALFVLASARIAGQFARLTDGMNATRRMRIEGSLGKISTGRFSPREDSHREQVPKFALSPSSRINLVFFLCFATRAPNNWSSSGELGRRLLVN